MSGIDDSYTKSLLHFDGSDASTTFIDESGKTWTAVAGAQLDTAFKKFGVSSLLLGTANDVISTPDSEDFNVGSGNFTVDFWFKTPAGDKYMFGQANTGGGDRAFHGYMYSDGRVGFRIQSGTTVYIVNHTTTGGADNNWHHYAGIRNGNNLYVAIDGVLSSATDVTGVTANNSSSLMVIGQGGEYAGSPYTGWIDEFRFSKGIARWTANFTPPTIPYDSSIINSKILLMGYGV